MPSTGLCTGARCDQLCLARRMHLGLRFVERKSPITCMHASVLPHLDHLCRSQFLEGPSFADAERAIIVLFRFVKLQLAVACSCVGRQSATVTD